ncbi:IclR family transcriptional regulator [Xylanimonas allomyrinae]|uniref:IclR family transcriptional regulator n=1 Tax=Xylanimonas allomyrinae TaxID=2509459 RepID=A0A4P6EIU3_9MICO|nr:IclR family transcriptional regulator [Xylanimonas allomyrinae]QAY62215.1 IclR family transcriptional regulator [Xylanimonas allomyrinae]
MQQKTDPYRIESVDRAMQLLTLLAERSQVSVTEAAAELGIAPSSAHRLLTTMAGRGFVLQGARRLYRAGPALLVAGSAARGTSSVISRLRPVLQALHDDVDETVHLQVLVGADAQFVDGIEATPSLRVALRTGARMPAYCTSGGKAMLAALPEPAVAALHSGGLRPWPFQRLHTLDELAAELAQVRARGYGVNRDESEVGVVATGVAAGAAPDDPVAAISLAVPSPRYDDVRAARLAQRLLAARDEAVRALRGR